VHNLYANEAKDGVPMVHTNLDYQEKMKTSQLGPMDTQTRACNTMKRTEEDSHQEAPSKEAPAKEAEERQEVEGTPSEPFKAPMQCPGSNAPDFAYAWAHTETEFTDSCDTVKKEIEARAKMENGWKDPHNNGTYKLNSATNGNTIVVDHYGGNAPHFHDKQMIVLVNGSKSKFEKMVRDGFLPEDANLMEAGGCTAYGCSDSQGVSAADGSTNYCNLHNLYANESKDNVKPVHTNLNYNEKKKSSQLGALDTDKKQCNTMKTETEVTAEGKPGEPFQAPMQCPGSKAPDFAYAWAHVVVDFQEDCGTVRKEMEARANMENGWKDPHRNGKYDIAKDSSQAVLVVDHFGGKAPHFHDKVDFVFESKRRRVEMEHHHHHHSSSSSSSTPVQSSSGCTVYACSNSQGVSAADSSTNYCNIRNLYANEKQDGVPMVHTDLQYNERKKTSQLGALDLDKRQCNTMKKAQKAVVNLMEKRDMLMERLRSMQ